MRFRHTNNLQLGWAELMVGDACGPGPKRSCLALRQPELGTSAPTWAPRLPGSLDRILLPHVHGVFFVFQAVVIHKFAVQYQRLVELHRPRRGIGLRIVDRDLDFEVSVVRPPDPFDCFGLLRQRFPARIQPKIVAEPAGFHHQRVAFPMAD